jgi:hypothetical protein
VTMRATMTSRKCQWVALARRVAVQSPRERFELFNHFIALDRQVRYHSTARPEVDLDRAVTGVSGHRALEPSSTQASHIHLSIK